MRFFKILSILLFISCTTTEIQLNSVDKAKVWEVKSFIQEGRGDYIPKIVKTAHAVYSENRNKITVHYQLSDSEVERLQSKWVEKYKKIKLEKITIVQEFSFIINESSAATDYIYTSYFLHGEEVESLQNKLNYRSYDNLIGESPGLIVQIIESNRPHPLEHIKTPTLYTNKNYTLTKEDNTITLSYENDVIVLEFQNDYNIIKE